MSARRRAAGADLLPTETVGGDGVIRDHDHEADDHRGDMQPWMSRAAWVDEMCDRRAA